MTQHNKETDKCNNYHKMTERTHILVMVNIVSDIIYEIICAAHASASSPVDVFHYRQAALCRPPSPDWCNRTSK